MNNTLSPTTYLDNSSVAIADSGCTKHYFTSSFHFGDTTPTTSPLNVTLPNNTIITSQREASLNLPHLSTHGNKVHIFKDLQSANLISIGQLCDDGCEVKFTKYNMIATKNNHTILTAHRNQHNGMWVIPFDNNSPPSLSSPTHLANGIIKMETTKNDLIHFLHLAAFSPT